MFDKILIANRGEIACRIIRTARRLGIGTVAVYSDADAEALHVELADEAFRIGPAPALESYLRGDRLLEVARQSKAAAIHPGYGFLAENAGFAEDCREAGIVFIGPSPETIRGMGDKAGAKRTVADAGVPLIPGYHGGNQDLESLTRAAEHIGYPLIIKASAGGGGKGMRVVRRPADLSEALASARREAASAFGSDLLLLEKYLEAARHIEVQVFGDTHGNLVHLFERDCSIQRRHQKILEESPAPGLSSELRAELGVAAVAAAKAVDYTGAGTVEFLLDADGSFYFMEMNTRLQVEHPVTEMVTGLDLVEWQLQVAAGAPLPCGQQELDTRGHAIEARIYAESPARDFLPGTGLLAHLRFPEPGDRLRIDTGVRQGDAVTIHYDPLIAKLIVWGPDREQALRRLQKGLSSCQVIGLTTNLSFLARVAAHPEYLQGGADTGFIPRHQRALLAVDSADLEPFLALACLAELHHRQVQATRRAALSADPFSPWQQSGGWRLNSASFQELRFVFDGAPLQVISRHQGDHTLLELPSGTVEARAVIDDTGTVRAVLGDRRIRATAVRRDQQWTIIIGAESHTLGLEAPFAPVMQDDAGGGRLTAPMPGKVIQVLVTEGETVERGAPLIILEAMKMENTIISPARGVVKRIRFSSGDQVTEGVALLEFEPAEEA